MSAIGEVNERMEETQKLIHELKVHQIELEAQNKELRRTQAELSLARERYFDLYNLAPVGYVTLNAKGIILEANLTAAELLGVPRSALMKMPFSRFIIAEDQDIYYHYRGKLFSDKDFEKGARGCELRIVKDDGIQFWASLRASVEIEEIADSVDRINIIDGVDNRNVENRQHPAKILHVVMSDVSERKIVDSQLSQSQKLESLGLLAGGVAHDFNNLLSGIFGYMELARECCDHNDCGKASKYLDSATQAFNRAKDLSRQLLTFAKGGAPIVKPQSVVPLIKRSVQFALSGSNVHATFNIPDDLWAVNIDENQIEQVLDNVVINAKQAMSAGGIINVSAKNIPRKKIVLQTVVPDVHRLMSLNSNLDYLGITIEDNGPGINKKDLQSIFDPFFSTKEMGRGLGLTIAYSIMKKHQGYIDVSSQLGKGTIFSFYLPALLFPVTEEKLELEKKKDKNFIFPYKVLFMDDENALCTIAEYYFKEEFKANFVSVSNGEEAIVLFRNAYKNGTPFDFVICDLTIPGGKGGAEIINELRRISIHSTFTAIASSGYSADPVMSRPREFGFDASLKKPYLKDDLIQVLQSIDKK